jgi:hypothetical protein
MNNTKYYMNMEEVEMGKVNSTFGGDDECVQHLG